MRTYPSLIDSPLAEHLRQALATKILKMDDYRGDLSILVDKQGWLELARSLKDHPKLAFDQMIDLTAVDYLKEQRKPRFQMVYHFLSLTHNYRLRVKIDLEEDDVEVDSICSLWLAANWYERECYDMLGMQFKGHPDLRRILLYEGFVGHPLRKDYPILKEQPLVPLKDIPERYDYMGYKQMETETAKKS